MKIASKLLALSLAAAAPLAAPLTPALSQAAAPRPSFSCGKSTNFAERSICGDAELARLDRILADLFAETRSLLLNAEQSSQADKDQRAWLTKRNRCTSVQCLRTAYFNRIVELARELPADG